MPVRWKCPICKTPTEPLTPFFPFCGDRCRTQDLANWSSEKYVISTPVDPLQQLEEQLNKELESE